MNRHLTETIVEHIYKSFAIIPSDFIDQNRSHSLIGNDYLLPEKLRFEIGGKLVQHSVWGCQVNITDKEFKVLLGDCSDDIYAFAMLVASKDLPTWGMYLRLEEPTQYADKEAMIACSIAHDKNDAWLEASTFLQASFLAGMEQLKDSGLSWSKPSDYQEEFQKLLSFIKYHNTVYEGEDEGQEEGF